MTFINFIKKMYSKLFEYLFVLKILEKGRQLFIERLLFFAIRFYQGCVASFFYGLFFFLFFLVLQMLFLVLDPQAMPLDLISFENLPKRAIAEFYHRFEEWQNMRLTELYREERRLRRLQMLRDEANRTAPYSLVSDIEANNLKKSGANIPNSSSISPSSPKKRRG